MLVGIFRSWPGAKHSLPIPVDTGRASSTAGVEETRNPCGQRPQEPSGFVAARSQPHQGDALSPRRAIQPLVPLHSLPGISAKPSWPFSALAKAHWSIVAVRLAVDIGLFLIVLVSLAVRRPFTIQYAREESGLVCIKLQPKSRSPVDDLKNSSSAPLCLIEK